jgi:hypothetical protein
MGISATGLDPADLDADDDARPATPRRLRWIMTRTGLRFESHGEAKITLFDYIEVLLQPAPSAFDARAGQSGRLRTARC